MFDTRKGNIWVVSTVSELFTCVNIKCLVKKYDFTITEAEMLVSVQEQTVSSKTQDTDRTANFHHLRLNNNHSSIHCVSNCTRTSKWSFKSTVMVKLKTLYYGTNLRTSTQNRQFITSMIILMSWLLRQTYGFSQSSLSKQLGTYAFPYNSIVTSTYHWFVKLVRGIFTKGSRWHLDVLWRICIDLSMIKCHLQTTQYWKTENVNLHLYWLNDCIFFSASQVQSQTSKI